jgi:hypothetical protein
MPTSNAAATPMPRAIQPHALLLVDDVCVSVTAGGGGVGDTCSAVVVTWVVVVSAVVTVVTTVSVGWV